MASVDMHETHRTLSQRAADMLAALMLAFAALLVGGMAIAAPFLSTFYTDVHAFVVGPDYSEIVTMLGTGLYTVVALPVLATAILLIVFCGLNRTLRRLPTTPVAVCSVAIIFAVAVAWLFQLNTKTNIYADSLRLDAYAKALLEGDYAVFSKDLGDGVPYLSIYPFQSGSVWLLAGVYALFGSGNQLPFQLLNAVCVALAAGCMIAICKMLFNSSGATNACSLLLVAFLPLPLSAALVYGNAIGLGLISLVLALNVYAMRCQDAPRRRWTAFGVSCLICAIALTVKSTFVLMLIALVLTWAIVLLRERRLRFLLVVLAAALVVNWAAGIPVMLLEHTVGVDFGSGMPKSSWIAMGMEWSMYLDKPGWWSGDYALNFAETGMDGDAQNAFALQHIGWSISTFIQDPLFTLRFFGVKLITEWLEPTFQSIYYSATSLADATTPLAREVIGRGHLAHRVIIAYMDAFQNLLYLSGAVGLVCAVRHRRAFGPAVILPAVSFLGGFACYLLWEAKSVYVFPFVLTLFPFAGYGIDALCGAVRTCMACGTVRAES